MSIGRHKTTKKPTEATYSVQWSGVSYAPHCPRDCRCPKCGTRTHLEAGSHYCPTCDDYVASDRGHID